MPVKTLTGTPESYINSGKSPSVRFGMKPISQLADEFEARNTPPEPVAKVPKRKPAK